MTRGEVDAHRCPGTVPSMLRTVRRLPAVVLLSLVVGVAVTACGTTSAVPSTTLAPLPAGPTPSKIATQVCAPEAQRDIANSLGERASVSTPTWDVATHVYSCTYSYPSGSFTISVTELSSWAQTIAYFNGLKVKYGVAQRVPNLGQAAFQAPNGLMFVRKDWKILTVDPSGLPAMFGKPPTSASAVAVTVAIVILGCWDGD